MIRPIVPKDLPTLEALECGFKWTFGRDYMGGLVFTDENDVPVMSVGAWSRAEVHAIFDPTWGTPGMRLAALKELHKSMEADLAEKQVGIVVTWMDGMKAFAKRLKGLGWVKSEKTCFLRRVG